MSNHGQPHTKADRGGQRPAKEGGQAQQGSQQRQNNPQPGQQPGSASKDRAPIQR